MSFLLDTDICSAHLKNDPHVASKVMQHSGRLAISVITLGELTTWVRRAKTPPQRLTDLQRMVDDLVVHPIDVALAAKFGELRARMLDSGLVIPVHDLWLAATAIEFNLILVTHNTRDFLHVPGLTVLDWMQP